MGLAGAPGAAAEPRAAIPCPVLGPASSCPSPLPAAAPRALALISVLLQQLSNICLLFGDGNCGTRQTSRDPPELLLAQPHSLASQNIPAAPGAISRGIQPSIHPSAACACPAAFPFLYPGGAGDARWLQHSGMSHQHHQDMDLPSLPPLSR